MILKKLAFIFSILIVFTTYLFAIEKDNIENYMKTNIAKSTQILQDKKLDTKNKAEQIFPLFEDMFDFELMGKLSLGKTHWTNFTDAQKKEFTDKFVHFLKNSYMNKLVLYTNEKVEIKDLQHINDKRIWLNTVLIGSKDRYDITYKFYKKKQNDWLIYDVNIIGVSLIKTYRAQFNDILKSNDYKTLISKLQ